MGRAQGDINRAQGFFGVDNPEIDAIKRIDNSGGGVATLVNSPITTTYVCDVNGSNASGLRGDIGSPFKTVQAGLNACLDGDILEISPAALGAAYVESVTVPVGRKSVTIRGSAKGVVIRPVVGRGFFFFPSIPGSSLELQDITIQTADAAAPAIEYDATTHEVGTSLRMTNVISGAVRVAAVQDALAQSCTVLDDVAPGNFSVFDCQRFRLRSSTVQTSLLLGYNGATALLDRGEYFVDSTDIGDDVTVTGHPLVRFNSETTCEAGLIGALTTYLVGPRDYAPNIEVDGQVKGSTTLVYSPLSMAATARNRADLSRGDFLSSVAIRCSAPDPVARVSVKAHAANFAGGLSAGESTTIDARNSSLTGGVVGLANGIIDRTYEETFGTLVGAGPPVTVPISPPLPNASYIVDIEQVSGAATVFVVAKTVSGYDLNTLAPGAPFAISSKFTRASSP
jgi:hypothetical protein